MNYYVLAGKVNSYKILVMRERERGEGLIADERSDERNFHSYSSTSGIEVSDAYDGLKLGLKTKGASFTSLYSRYVLKQAERFFVDGYNISYASGIRSVPTHSYSRFPEVLLSYT